MKKMQYRAEKNYRVKKYRQKQRETLVKRMNYKIREEMRESKRESGMSTLKVFC